MNLRKSFILVFTFYLFLLASSYTSYYVGKNDFNGYIEVNSIPHEFVIRLLSPIMIAMSIIEGDGNVIENRRIPGGINHYVGNFEINGYTNYNLLTAYKFNDSITIELLDLLDGKSIKKWDADFDKIAKLTKEGNKYLSSHWFVNSIVHPLMLKDSSVIFGTWESVAKINANSNIEWVKSDYKSHHTIEKDDENNVWFSGRRNMTEIKDILRDDITKEEKMRFIDDLVMKINPDDGEVLFEKSVIELLIENNLGYLINGNGYYDLDPIHLNDVQPALEEGEYWKKGDLLLSLRNLSTIVLYRPSTNKVLWHRQGPWLNQHDADFVDDDKISVFGNQIYRGESSKQDSKYLNNPSQFNSVFVYDFSTDSISEPYKEFIESEKIKTFTEGRSEILPNGDLFIEETNNGRIFISDSSTKKMSFSKRINKEQIANLYWSRIIKN